MLKLADIEKEFDEVRLVYPSLDKLAQMDTLYRIDGTISIIDANGYNWGEYEIELLVPPNYPAELPRLLEKGQKIKRHQDWHINKHGICCLGTDARQFRDLNGRFSLLNWIKLFVVPYLANHIHKKDKGDYADGELPHDDSGLFLDYASCFGVKEPVAVIERLQFILGTKRMSLNNDCFCGSNKKYKRCFLRYEEKHRLGIPKQTIFGDLKKLKAYYQL